ncbi:hypothetical protein M948_17830 [Virgibacillus sp. CM-4]|uniref:HAD family hydrolase n=1 Tax=Virgibacillus sp. CM-4 TaxID=1354277 RepID=UPI0003887CDE|nr:HAD family hydrolase [Virgibacillus sp. CM-4]EQB34969.1 hypothetical protein M948_17830 [Virgibacillus sp. CM-4]
MLKAIIFDLDDTLLWDSRSVSESFKETCKLAEDKNPVIDPIQLENRVRQEARTLYASYPTYKFTQMIGINPFEGLWGEFNDEGESFKQLNRIAPQYRKDVWTNGLQAIGVNDSHLGLTLANVFVAYRKKNSFVYQDTFSVLDKLYKKYRLALLTNGSPDLQQTKLAMTAELERYFEQIVISGEFGKGKPDPGIFQYMLKQLGVAKDEVLMVGDNLHTDILGASRAEIASIWINRNNLDNNEIPTYEVNRLSEILSIIKE